MGRRLTTLGCKLCGRFQLIMLEEMAEYSSQEEYIHLQIRIMYTEINSTEINILPNE